MNSPTDPYEYGFSPDADGKVNRVALQKALDRGGTITVSGAGEYPIAGTVFIGSDTHLSFAPGVVLRKSAEEGPFVHVLLNKGALTRSWDKNITVAGLKIIVNKVDSRDFLVYGLHGHLAFFYAKNVRIFDFALLDLEPSQYAIHVCTFEDLIVERVRVEGKKDGVHLGRGRRFTIRDCVFKTFDDAVALNAHDYSTGNPELGWIEDGVVENCHDLADDETTGFFCRILAGGWKVWEPDMTVQQSDSVVSNGRLYRVQARPDSREYVSRTQPIHESGTVTLDDIPWGVVQNDTTQTAGVRNVVFRDIFLHKTRVAFSVHFDQDRYSRSYYPGAPVPVQKGLQFENVQVLHNAHTALIAINTPVDTLQLHGCQIRGNHIAFRGTPVPGIPHTRVSVTGSTFHTFPVDELITVDGDSQTAEMTESANIVIT